MKLKIATEEEKRRRDELCHAAWGRGLDVPAFQLREKRLRSHPWARDSMESWLLVDGDSVLSSCETFAMDSFLPDGEAGRSFGIASVFTQSELRGRGHALSMIRLLLEELPRRHADAQAALLFSEVGAALYQRAGFVTIRQEEDFLVPTGGEAPEVEWLSEGELRRAWAAIPRRREGFVIHPSAEQLDWHLERERYYAEALQRPRPLAIGARCDSATAIWSADYKNEELVVLLAHADGPRSARRLVRAASHAAAPAGLRAVRIWDVPEFPLGELPRAARHDLPMLHPFRPEIDVAAMRPVFRGLWM